MQRQGWCAGAEHGLMCWREFKSSSGSNCLSPWPPAIFCVSVNFTHTHLCMHVHILSLSPPPHTCSLANRPFSIAILLYLWADMFYPSVDVTDRPLPPYLTAQVQLPGGQWAVIPHSPVSCHEMATSSPQKLCLLCFISLVRDPLWVTLLVRSPQMPSPYRSLP